MKPSTLLTIVCGILLAVSATAWPVERPIHTRSPPSQDRVDRPTFSPPHSQPPPPPPPSPPPPRAVSYLPPVARKPFPFPDPEDSPPLRHWPFPPDTGYLPPQRSQPPPPPPPSPPPQPPTACAKAGQDAGLSACSRPGYNPQCCSALRALAAACSYAPYKSPNFVTFLNNACFGSSGPFPSPPFTG